MKQSARIKLAAVATTVTIGGLTALGIAFGGRDSNPVDTASATRPETVQRKEVRRIPVKQPRSGAAPAPTQAPQVVGAPSAQPAVVSDPQPVTSQTSPSAGGGYDEEGEDGGESESGESGD
ncbi:MAG TPA: hypothetical protein VEK39_11160 [Solirubrobacterales bacterium]|nr:hypothetical protein [Candidatus Acidoferrum sp.]HYU61310.1 hypothetical protein [Solirubrobacterales bacterium]